MTPDDLVHALLYRQQEMRVLNEAVGRDMNAVLVQNKRLDDPAYASAPTYVVQGLLGTRQRQTSTRLLEARLAVALSLRQRLILGLQRAVLPLLLLCGAAEVGQALGHLLDARAGDLSVPSEHGRSSPNACTTPSTLATTPRKRS